MKYSPGDIVIHSEREGIYMLTHFDGGFETTTGLCLKADRIDIKDDGYALDVKYLSPAPTLLKVLLGVKDGKG